MRPFFIAALLLVFVPATAQQAFLFVKKGIKKKRTYMEGDRILLRLTGDTIIGGLITHMRNDTIFILGKPVPVARVKGVIIRSKKDKSFKIPANQLLLITGGVALTTTGLTLSKQASLEEALTAGLVIGYGPLVVQYIASKIRLARREFPIGKKFRLHLIDFHIQRRKAF